MRHKTSDLTLHIGLFENTKGRSGLR